MKLFEDFRTPLYVEAIRTSQRSFSSRMGLNDGRNVFIERIDRDHEPIQRALQEGLLRIEQVYNDSMKKLLKNTGLSGAAGVSLGSLWFGIGLMVAAPGAGIFGAAFGAIFGGVGGLFTGAILTQTNASTKKTQSLIDLFNIEVEFALGFSSELNRRILEHPEERAQLEQLKSQFDWVIARPKAIEKEAWEAKMNDISAPTVLDQSNKHWYERSRKKMEEEDRYNRRLAQMRSLIR